MLMEYSENQESVSSLLEIEKLMAELLSIDQRSKFTITN